MTDDKPDPEDRFESRNEAIRQTIDVLASYDAADLDEFGAKAEIADEHGLEQHRIHYALRQYEDLVQHRRNANRNPLNPDAVKEAYSDETMQAMAGERQAVSDGAGEITVEIEMSLDEVFRAIKLLPGDLGIKLYSQVLSGEFDRSELRKLLDR